MRVLILGAGAIGSVLGGFLARAGHDVTLLGRAWHVDVVRREGLRLTGLWGTHHIRTLAVATDPEAAAARGPFEWVLVCVKAHQTAGILPILPRLLGPSTLVCALQNGLGNFETLLQVVSPARLALGRVIFGAELEPGHARVTVCADEVVIGAPDARFPSTAAAALAQALKASGVPARPTTSILPVIWAKVLYNCALNGLSTLLEVSYGVLATHPVSPRVIRAIIEEAYQVAAAHRIALEPSTAAAYTELLFATLIPATASHRASMLQDVRRGHMTEIEALNGALVRLGAQVGVATPTNALIARLVHAKEQWMGVRSG